MTRRILCAQAFGGLAIGLISTIAAAPTSARAEIVLPYCLSGGGGGYDNCSYVTYAQCQASAASFGVCSPNPKYAPPSASVAKPHTKRGEG